MSEISKTNNTSQTQVTTREVTKPKEKENLLLLPLRLFGAWTSKTHLNDAERRGLIAAYNLNGNTSQKEVLDFKHSVSFIKKHTKPEDMHDFLKGYEEYKAAYANHFFTQLATEHNFKLKDECGEVYWDQNNAIKDLGNKFIEYLKKCGGLPEDIEKFEKILQKEKYSKADTKELDKIVAQYIN